MHGVPYYPTTTQLNIDIRNYKICEFQTVEIWKNMDPPLIKSEINGGPSYFNSCFNHDLPPPLWCSEYIDEENIFLYFRRMKVKVIGVHLMHKARI